MNVFWCDKCGTPVLGLDVWEQNGIPPQCGICGSSVKRIASDIRPVFSEEKRLLEVLLKREPGSLLAKTIWDTNSSNLVIDGETFVLRKGDIMEEFQPEQVREDMPKYKISQADQDSLNKSIAVFVEANRMRLNEITIQAEDIIREARRRYPRFTPIVSFSGGKDSTALSDIVRRVYADQRILHVNVDTTLEIPETLAYVERFQKAHGIPMPKPLAPRHDFKDVCNRIGPPSRVMRWCCTIFKNGPLDELLDSFSLANPILTFYGIRKSESNLRSKYEAITPSAKSAKQTVVSPIIDWVDGDIWLYILSHGLDFNGAYRLGFSRAGCWVCPSNSQWSGWLNRVYQPELAEDWRDYLIEVAKGLGKPDPEEYVDSGNWKKRQGGQGLSTAFKGIVTSHPCGDDPDAKTYTLTKPISDDLYEFFKPFGRIDMGRGRALLGEVVIVDKQTNSPIMLVQGRAGQYELRVKIVESNNPTLLMQRVDCQIRKYQSCILCTGCPPVCPVHAISDRSGRYTIDEDKCINCLECVSHYDTGCLVSKVLKIKKGSI